MTKKICITSTHSVGCTFIEWSLHFLSGQNYYFNVVENKLIELSQNPLLKTNAHGHDKNHPIGSKNFKEYLEISNTITDIDIFSLYSSPIPFHRAAKYLELSFDKFDNKDTFKKISNYIHDDYNKIFKICNDHDVKLIFVAPDSRTALYYQCPREYYNCATSLDYANNQNSPIYKTQNLFFSKI